MKRIIIVFFIFSAFILNHLYAQQNNMVGTDQTLKNPSYTGNAPQPAEICACTINDQKIMVSPLNERQILPSLAVTLPVFGQPEASQHYADQFKVQAANFFSTQAGAGQTVDFSAANLLTKIQGSKAADAMTLANQAVSNPTASSEQKISWTQQAISGSRDAVNYFTGHPVPSNELSGHGGVGPNQTVMVSNPVQCEAANGILARAEAAYILVSGDQTHLDAAVQAALKSNDVPTMVAISNLAGSLGDNQKVYMILNSREYTDALSQNQAAATEYGADYKTIESYYYGGVADCNAVAYQQK